MKVQNMKSSKGNLVPNQFTFRDTNGYVYFQSYGSIIARVDLTRHDLIRLDSKYWDYSRTTSKYRNMFLDMTTPEIKKAIKKGTIILTDLNPSSVSFPDLSENEIFKSSDAYQENYHNNVDRIFRNKKRPE